MSYFQHYLPSADDKLVILGGMINKNGKVRPTNTAEVIDFGNSGKKCNMTSFPRHIKRHTMGVADSKPVVCGGEIW